MRSCDVLVACATISTPWIGSRPGRNRSPRKLRVAGLPSGKPLPITSRRSPTSAVRGEKSLTASNPLDASPPWQAKSASASKKNQWRASGRIVSRYT